MRLIVLYAALAFLSGCGLYELAGEAADFEQIAADAQERVSELESLLASAEATEEERERLEGLLTMARRQASMDRIEAENAKAKLQRKIEETADTAEAVTGVGANLTGLAGSFGIPGIAGVGMVLSAVNGALRRRNGRA